MPFRVSGCANIGAQLSGGVETSRKKIVARLERDGWVNRGGGEHDVYVHPTQSGRVVVPRHKALSGGVSRAIAMVAGWKESQ
jgi:predicted RNA binding protein YcfA (HicA-like mRNA interferase family)